MNFAQLRRADDAAETFLASRLNDGNIVGR
jgi:hypothetical protein